MKMRNTQLLLANDNVPVQSFQLCVHDQTAQYYKCKPYSVAEYLSLLDDHVVL